MMVAVISHWDQHHIRNRPAKWPRQYKTVSFLVVFKIEFSWIDQVLVPICYLKRLLKSILDFFNLVINRYTKYLIFEHVTFISFPVKWKVGPFAHFEIGIPEALFTQCHLVSYKEYHNEMLIMRSILIRLLDFIINLTNPAPSKLILIDGDAYRNIDRALIKLDTFTSSHTYKLSLLSEGNGIMPRRASTSVLFEPCVESHVLLLLLKFLRDLPIRLELLSWVTCCDISTKSIV